MPDPPSQPAGPGTDRPLAAYAALSATFLTATVGALALLERTGRPVPRRVGWRDLALLGVATHKLSRLLSKERATAFARAPFTEHRGSAGHGEVEERPAGTGIRRAVGELVTCPYCLGMWVAGGLVTAYVASPRLARLGASVLTILFVSDVLQIAYKAAEERQDPG